MDCCKFGEYRAHGPYGAAAWEGYGYAPLPYAPYAAAPYAHYPAAHAHDPYARYYRFDYPAHHVHHAEHAMPMDYGAYASKETRVRRALARRDQRAHTPVQHLPLPPTPPLECGVNGRGPAYCEPQMWPHYQMGVMGGGSSNWNGANAVSSGWAPRSACSRDHMRYPSESRPMKSVHMHSQNQTCLQDGRSTPYPIYEEKPYNGDTGTRQRNTPEFKSSVAQMESSRSMHERFERCPVEPRHLPPEEKRAPPVVPLPAFQQAFGSTEIGKFAEAFSRTEIVVDDASTDSFVYESYPEWDGPLEPQWPSQPVSREIKCEDNF